ncbi:ferritin-like domain-containing protein [Mycolicibacterium poriferae]|uniref:ferritin-like domain-containing protein n=1 Tax=Mycolicibacterium poriferae TaxID=39694 RepID=UPI0024B9F858|nr:ferritin-like domain-containing protein [Mycolicibacterium poriferae]
MTTPTTSPSAQPEPTRPGGAADGALYDALEVEHAAIYGYGIVSAHSTFDRNYLVADAMNEHRARREAGIALMEERGAQAPLPAAGYRLPGEVDNPRQAAELAVTMEQDAAVAWRAVIEQADDQTVRAFGVTALTECAVTASRWRRLMGETPVTVAFPGGSE